MRSLYDEMVAVADAPLPDLIESQDQVHVEAVVDEWRLPEADREALRSWGLPTGPLLSPGPQSEAQPVLVPNIAGESERRLLSADQRLYLLGVYGSDYDPELSIRVGAVAGTGQVMGIRGRPLTVDDIAVPLRPYHPNLYHPAVHYFNQSVAAFVEVAWRWRAAVARLNAHPEPRYDAPLEAHEEHQAEIERSCTAFFTRMSRLDSTLADNSLWISAITEDL
jgi:hypothetical protein